MHSCKTRLTEIHATDCVKRRVARKEEWRKAMYEDEHAADEEASGLATTDDSLSSSLIVEPPADA